MDALDVSRWQFGITTVYHFIFVPLTLERMKVDPAISSSIFVTMTTDSMGFLVFLGLATVSGIVK